VALSEIASLGRAGAQVIALADDDALGWATLTRGGEELVLVSALGKAIRFAEDEVRPQGLSASGMRGMALAEGDHLVGMDRAQAGADLLVVTRRGFAKRTALSEYTAQGRGGQGAWTVDASKSEESGPLVAALVAPPQGQAALLTSRGGMQIVGLSAVPRLARDSWGRVVTRTRRGAVATLAEGEELTGALLLLPVGAAETPPQPTAGQVRPKRSQRAAQTPQPKPEAAASEPSSPPAAATTEDKPTAQAAPSRQRRSRTATARPAAAPPPEEGATPEKPPTRRRRSSAAKAEPEPPPTTETHDDQATASPAPRTRRAGVRRPPQRSRPKE